MLLADALPEFADELAQGLRALGYAQLAKSVYSVEIVERCACDEPGCITFYAVSKADVAHQRECDRVVSPAKGVLCVHYIDHQIIWIEAIGRATDRVRLDQPPPIRGSKPSVARRPGAR